MIAENSTHVSSCEAHSLFGLLTALDAKTETTSIIIVILFVLLVERTFHMLRHSTHDTPFQGMVQKIENELMIVGFMAFLLKIIISLTHEIDENWLLSLEFADLVIPIISFCFCFQGFILVMTSMRQCMIWSKACYLKPIELCHDYYQIGEQWASRNFLSKIVHFVPTLISWYRVVVQMEFRVFRTIFSDTHNIHESLLDFDEYIDMLYEHYLSELVSIEMEDWAVIVCIAFILLLRTDTDSSGCHKGDPHCEDRIGVYVFFGIGVALFITLGIITILGRYYMRQLLATKGVKRELDLPAFINKTVDANDSSSGKLSVSEMKEMLESRRKSVLAASKQGFLRELQWKRLWRRGNVSEIVTALRAYTLSFIRSDVDLFPGSQSANSVLVSSEKLDDLLKDGRHPTEGHEATHAHSEVFLFGSHHFYELILKRVNICIAAYNGFLLANFISASKHMSVMWQALVILPGFLSLQLFIYCVRSAIVFKFVCELDEDVLESVLENSEASANLRQSVRDKLIARLSAAGDPEAALSTLFNELDEDGSGSLGRSELMVLMRRLDVNLSRKQRTAFFKAVDRNADDDISLHEFILFLFPTHAEASRKEEERLHDVKKNLSFYRANSLRRTPNGSPSLPPRVSEDSADAPGPGPAV